MPMRLRGLAAIRGYAGVVDINQTSLVMSGLALGTLNPGQTVTVVFTVSHSRPFTGVELFPAVDTFSGIVVDPSTGLVVDLMDSGSVSLKYGRYTAVRITSLGVLPTNFAGQPIEVQVGPSTLFAADIIGQPPASNIGVLSATGTVNTTAKGPPNPPPPGTGSSLTTYLVGGAALAAAVAGAAAIGASRRNR